MAFGGPMQQNPVGSLADLTGEFPGGYYKIDHRDTNTLLSVTLLPNGQIFTQPGAMVAMTPDVTLKGKLKFSFRKMITGGEMSQTTYTGPGEILFAPPVWGDIIAIHLDGNTRWTVGKGGYLGMSDGITKETKSQGLGKAIFSGEGLFVQQFMGRGVLFITSLGGIVQRHLKQGDQLIVDNGHLVAWTCTYSIERAGGSISAGAHSGEGLVCRFTGPGIIYIQTRNPDALSEWIAGQAHPRQ
ncbi:unnamed protein product [Adineta steineri]|uniref:Altered inheritance of mitochondria protein 24, mitochondrial n=1 Tax=Adineta steineri TaxID=433720 RepID=A0A815BPG1_9BILA|nr:unnamed protein product [Adineta steineri]CAF1509898.1 unnamed protein product [Adineta steineri]